MERVQLPDGLVGFIFSVHLSLLAYICVLAHSFLQLDEVFLMQHFKSSPVLKSSLISVMNYVTKASGCPALILLFIELFGHILDVSPCCDDYIFTACVCCVC